MKTVVFADTARWDTTRAGESRIGREDPGSQLVASCVQEFSEWDVRFLRPNLEEPKEFAKLIESGPCDALVLFPFTYTKHIADGLARLFKGRIPVIYGGQHAGIGAMPARTLAEGLADFVIAGRGDTSLPKLLIDIADGKKPEAKILRHHDDVPKDEKYPLDRLPWPMRREDLMHDITPKEPLPFIPPLTLEPNPTRCVLIAGSIGCSARCDFCSTWMISGSVLRRSPKNIVAEMEYLQKNFGPGLIFMFADPLFNSDREWVLDLSQEMEKRGPFTSVCMADFRLDREMVRAMKRGGFYWIMLGLEFASNDMRANRGKHVADPVNAFRICSEEGVITRALFMVARKGMTYRELDAEIAALESMPIRADQLRVNLEVPFPGTQMAHNLKPEDIVLPDQTLWTTQFVVFRTEVPTEKWEGIRQDMMRSYVWCKRQLDYYAKQIELFPELEPVYADFLEKQKPVSEKE